MRSKTFISRKTRQYCCKYLLCCLVHKDCKDISTRPCEQPADHTRVAVREAARLELTSERAEARSQRPVERYGDVDHMMKKVRVVGMEAQAEKIEVDTIH